jgi:hypothetical protein
MYIGSWWWRQAELELRSAALTVIAYLAWRRWNEVKVYASISKLQEEAAKNHIASLDGTSPSLVSPKDVPAEVRHSNYRARRSYQISRLVRFELDLDEFTYANELAARRIARKHILKLPHLRHSDLNGLLTAVVRLAFVPGRTEVDARQMYATQCIQERLINYRQNVKTQSVLTGENEVFRTSPPQTN